MINHEIPPGGESQDVTQAELDKLFTEIVGKTALLNAASLETLDSPPITYQGLPFVYEKPWYDAELPGDRLREAVPETQQLIDSKDTLVFEHNPAHFRSDLGAPLYVPESIVIDYWKGTEPFYESAIELEHKRASGKYRVYRRLNAANSTVKLIKAKADVLPLVPSDWQEHDPDAESVIDRDEYELLEGIISKFDKITGMVEKHSLYIPSVWLP
ncbi:MAG TPA: hypothetical protein VFN51_00105 [Candidatus Saccharimonadales bacterium]|nr:hypothetical protein [Candidatus Saccharimonadales bacterium]